MVVLSVLGCGPVGYLQQVRGRAADAVAEAKRAGAESAAPYEYTSAVAYLDKAREEGGQAEYQVAIDLGKRAEAFALKARAVARRARTSPPEAAAGDPPVEDEDKEDKENKEDKQNKENESAPSPGRAPP